MRTDKFRPLFGHCETAAGSNASIALVPGALAAGLGDGLFSRSLGASLAIAFVVAVPVNRWLIACARGHAVVHDLHAH